MKHFFNGKKLVPAGVLILVWIAACCALLKRQAERADSSVEHFVKLVRADFDPDAVSELRVVWKKDHAVLKKTSSGWVVSERNHPADAKRIAGVTDLLRRLVPLRMMEPVTPELCEELRVTPSPRKKESLPGVRLTLLDASGKILYDLMLGRGHLVPGRPAPAGERMPDGRFCGRILPDGKILPFLTDALFDEVHPFPGIWLRPPAFPEEKQIRTLRFQVKNVPLWLLARPSGTSSFRCVRPSGGSADSRMLGTVQSVLQHSYVLDCLPADQLPKNCRPEGVFGVEDFSGGVYALYFYSRPGTEEIYVRPSAPVRSAAAMPQSVRHRVESFRTAGRAFVYRVSPQIFQMLRTGPVVQPVNTEQLRRMKRP